MRIDLAITELDTGGAERCCTELAIYLSDKGHSVRVIAIGPEPVPPNDALIRKLSDRSIEMHFLGGKSLLALPMVAKRFRSLLMADRPDLVQSFLWHANVLSASIAPRLKIPLVGGLRVAEPRRSRHFLGGWAARRMQRVVCVSQGVAAWCIAKERVDPKKIVVIPNGVELSLNSRSKETDSTDSRPILLFVGRLELQKGVDVLLSHAPALLSELPNHQLVLIGDGSYRSEITQWTQRPELAGRVTWLGHRHDVRAWMARSQLLLLPARYEGMPNVVLEAMAEGLPIVTTRVEGMSELLSDDLGLQTVASGDWQAFFEKTILLANDAAWRQRLSDLNRQRVEREFGLSRQLEKYVQLYNRMLTVGWDPIPS